MLGIIIGVGAVIAMVSIGEGAKQAVQKQIATMGTNVIYDLAQLHNHRRRAGRTRRRCHTDGH